MTCVFYKNIRGTSDKAPSLHADSNIKALLERLVECRSSPSHSGTVAAVSHAAKAALMEAEKLQTEELPPRRA